MIKAVIFDMDGVIADTQKVHSRLESEVLKDLGINLEPKAISKRFAGVSLRILFPELLKENNVKFNKSTVENLINKKRDLMMAEAKNGVIPMPGIFKLINSLKENNFKIAVGSASQLNLIHVILSNLKIKDEFHAIASCQECAKGKPDPAVFLLAAKRIKINPEECIVIEDGFSGMLAAKSAGMKCIGLVEDKTDSTYPADLLIESLEELSIDIIKNL